MVKVYLNSNTNCRLHWPISSISTPLLSALPTIGHTTCGIGTHIGTAHQCRGIIPRDTRLLTSLSCRRSSLRHPPSLLLFAFQQRELHKFLLLWREAGFIYISLSNACPEAVWSCFLSPKKHYSNAKMISWGSGPDAECSEWFVVWSLISHFHLPHHLRFAVLQMHLLALNHSSYLVWPRSVHAPFPVFITWLFSFSYSLSSAPWFV